VPEAACGYGPDQLGVMRMETESNLSGERTSSTNGDPQRVASAGASKQKRLLLSSAGALLLFVAAAASWVASRRMGGDFVALHCTALGIVRGAPVYDRAWQLAIFASDYPSLSPQGMFYPPATGAAVAPFGLLPYRVAQVLWLTLMIGTVTFGVRELVRTVRPNSPAYGWSFAAGLVLLSACVRWGMTPLQGAPLVLGLLCIFVAALHTERHVLAAVIATFAIAFKFTLALPFLLLLLLYRRYRALAVAVGAWVALNALGFARMGGLSALRQYRANVAVLEAPGDLNTPDPWDPQSFPRTDWTYLLDGITRDLRLSQIATKLLTVAVGLFLVHFALTSPPIRSLRVVAAFLMAAACLGSLAVYHHIYDLSPLLVPALLFLLLRKQFALPNWMLALAFPVLALIVLTPIGLLQNLVRRAFGPSGTILINLAFPISITLALISSIAALRLLRREEAAASR
jgi:hypothetical protein